MKNITRSIMLFTLMVVMLISGSITVFASSDSNQPSKLVGDPSMVITQDFMPFTTQTEGTANPHIVYSYSPSILNGASPIIFTDTTTGMPAYCIDYNRGVPSPDSLDGEIDFNPETIFDANTYDGLKCLLLAGYPYAKGNGLTDAEAHGCTQLAVWCWTYETMGYGLDANNYTAIPGKEHIYDYFTSLMDAARNQNWPELELSATDVHMAIDGETLIGLSSVNFSNLDGGYTIDESVLSEGITLSGYTGNNGDVLTFTAPISYAGQSITLNAILAGHDERSELNLFWYDNKNPSQQRMAISVTDTATVAINADISMDFEGYGSVKVIKQSATDGKPLQNAVFGIYSADNDEKIAEIVTNEHGETSYQLPVGEYYLLELIAPEGYIQDEAKIDFTVLNGETAQKIVENNNISGCVKITKINEAGNPLNGAVFGIFNATDDKEIAGVTTSGTGIAIYDNLVYGSYYIKELEAPTGYLLSEEKIPFEVKSQGETIELAVKNTKEPIPEGKIRIIKKDAASSKLLQNAIFGFYDATNDVRVCELKTDDKGTATSPNLPAGDYYLKELSAPAGYIINSEKIGVTVKADAIVEIIVTNKAEPVTPPPVEKPGKLIIFKKADSTGEKLKGAVFALFRSVDDVEIAELTTDIYGEAKIELPAGDYYLREITAPSGYKLSTDRIGVKIKAGEIKEITITNKVDPTVTPSPVEKRGKLVITKKADGTGEKLEGAVFALYQTSDDEKLEELTTDNYGEATVSPPVGDYYLCELKAPSGYILKTDRINVKIKAGEVKELTVTNAKEVVPTPLPNPTPKPVPTPAPQPTPKPTPTPTPVTPTEKGELVLLKKAEQTGKPLAGAVFGVYSVSDNKKIAEITSNVDGKATLPLEIGDFYLKEIKAPYGYILETTKIYFSVSKNMSVTVEVTNLRDENIVDVDVPLGNIEIPKTGENFPTVNYTLGASLMTIAFVCGISMFRKRKELFA